MEATYALAAYMLVGAGRAADVAEATSLLKEQIQNKKALDKLAEFVKAQGGDERYVYEPERFPTASIIHEVKAPEDGWISAMNTEEIGMTSLILGGGRETKESEIDLTVGIIFKKKIGDQVACGDTIAILHANDAEKCALAEKRLLGAITIGKTQVAAPKHILGLVE